MVRAVVGRTSRIRGWVLLAILALTQGCTALLKADNSTFAMDHPDSAPDSVGTRDSGPRTGVPDASTSSGPDHDSIGTRDSGRPFPSPPDASRSDVLTPIVDGADASSRRHDASTGGGGRDAGSGGRASHDADAHPLDAGHLADGSSGRCDPNGAFGLPDVPGQAFVQSSAYDDVGFTLSADGLTAYFASTRLTSDNYDLFVARRVSQTDPFDEAEPLAGPINTPGQEREPSLSPDGSELFFTDQSDLFVARRGAGDEQFGPGMPVENVNTSFAEGDPYIASDGKSLYFTSNRNDMPRIYVSSRDDAGHFGEPRLVLVNAPDGSDAPVVSHDQLTLVVRSGSNGSTWVVRRASTSVAFDLASSVQVDPTLNVRWPLYLSDDECTLYFVMLRQHRSIWMTTRSR